MAKNAKLKLNLIGERYKYVQIVNGRLRRTDRPPKHGLGIPGGLFGENLAKMLRTSSTKGASVSELDDARHRYRPLDFSAYPKQPVFDPVAYYWRRYVTIADAIRAWRLDDPGEPLPGKSLQELAAEYAELWNQFEQEKTDDERRERLYASTEEIGRHAFIIFRHETRPYREKAGDVLLAALGCMGGFDYQSAREAISEWKVKQRKALGIEGPFQAHIDKTPLEHAAHEVEAVIEPLLTIYEDPQAFFRDVWPKRLSSGTRLSEESFPSNLRDHLRGGHDLFRGRPRLIRRSRWHDGYWRELAEELATWGFGLLSNPEVRAVFDEAASEPGFSLVLAQAERRQAFKDSGRPRERDWEALVNEHDAIPLRPQGRRSEWIKATAKALGMEEASFRSKLTSWRKKTRKTG